jgi:hypothetical protein
VYIEEEEEEEGEEKVEKKKKKKKKKTLNIKIFIPFMTNIEKGFQRRIVQFLKRFFYHSLFKTKEYEHS